MPASLSGQMKSHGYYGAHSAAQHSAGGLGVPLLERAVDEVPLAEDSAMPIVIADLGAAGGRNELAPMAAAITGLRNRRDHCGPIVVVHTDIPANDFSTLFYPFTTVALLHATDMLAVTPESMPTYFKGSGLVSVLPIRLQHTLDSFGIIMRRGRWMSSSVQLFTDAVRNSRRLPR